MPARPDRVAHPAIRIGLQNVPARCRNRAPSSGGPASFAAAAAVLWLLAIAPGFANTWPDRPVRVVVPYAAGGNTDLQARIVSERLAAGLGQPFLVENRVGAGGAIAAELVARAPADGTVFLFAATPQISILPQLRKVGYDLARFAPVSPVGSNAQVLAVGLAAPATLTGFVREVAAHPGAFNCGSAGEGSLSHLSGSLFLARAGLSMVHVPYKGGSLAVQDLAAGQIQMYFGNPAEVVSFVREGRIRALALSSERRSSLFPGVPALAESYPGFRTVTWNGYLAPAGTSRSIVEQLAAAIGRVVAEPATAARLQAIGVEPYASTPDEFARRIEEEQPLWRDAIRAAGLVPER